MYFVNNVQLNLAELSPYTPKEQQYRGNGEIEAMIMAKWKELKEKYGDKNEKLTFVCPAIKSGIGQGNMGGSFDRTMVVQTQSGTKVVVWADTAIKVAEGVFSFKPVKYRHSPERKSMVLDIQQNIEEILYLTLFDPYRKQTYTFPLKDEAGNPHPQAGRTVNKVYLLDRNEEAESYLHETSKSADMKFYLTSERSPIIKNRDLLNVLASAWGVAKPENKSDAIIRMELMQAVESFEKQHSEEWGYEGFCDKVSNMVESGEDPRTEVMAIIGQSIDRSIIKYAAQKLSWMLIGENGTEIKKICGVPPSESEKPKEALCGYLLRNPDDLALVQGAVDDKPLYRKTVLKVYIPQPPTEAWFREEMEYPKMKTACNILGINPLGKKKNELVEYLIDHFVTKNRTIPDENLLEHP